MQQQAGGMERRMEAFRQKCREKGLALTHQREIIYRALSSTRTHPSPEAIFEVVKEQIPSISLGTVYKNIKTFVESGLLKEVSEHHGSLRLDANMSPHHHLVCSECKAILDLEETEVEPVRLKRRLPGGFRVHRFSVEVIGLCATCAGKAAAGRKAKHG